MKVKEAREIKNRIINGERTATPFSDIFLLDLPDLQKKMQKNLLKKNFH